MNVRYNAILKPFNDCNLYPKFHESSHLNVILSNTSRVNAVTWMKQSTGGSKEHMGAVMQSMRERSTLRS